jgi:hypothetical protein
VRECRTLPLLRTVRESSRVAFVAAIDDFTKFEDFDTCRGRCQHPDTLLRNGNLTKGNPSAFEQLSWSPLVCFFGTPRATLSGVEGNGIFRHTIRSGER